MNSEIMYALEPLAINAPSRLPSLDWMEMCNHSALCKGLEHPFNTARPELRAFMAEPQSKTSP